MVSFQQGFDSRFVLAKSQLKSPSGERQVSDWVPVNGVFGNTVTVLEWPYSGLVLALTGVISPLFRHGS
jgi:hypothetical protein